MYVAFFQLRGTSPIYNESEKNRCRNGAISCGAFFNTQQGIWSGPAAFLTSRLLNSLAIPAVSKCNLEMLGKACGMDGKFSRSSWVKTDLNRSDKRFAFFLLSCTASPIPFSFKGEIQIICILHHTASHESSSRVGSLVASKVFFLQRSERHHQGCRYFYHAGKFHSLEGSVRLNRTHFLDESQWRWWYQVNEKQ